MNYEKVNDLLEEFYKSFNNIEKTNLSHAISNLTTTELHVIEAIGNESLSMHQLADKLSITMGTATVAISKLSKKKCIYRRRSSKDKRMVFVSLSPKGLEALDHHNRFHKHIIGTITKDLNESELESFILIFEKILGRLKTIN